MTTRQDNMQFQTLQDTAVVKQSQGVSSRKNLWESGAVATSAEKKAARAGEPHGANLASRKNLWLKATQEPAEKSSKAEVETTCGVVFGLTLFIFIFW